MNLVFTYSSTTFSFQLCGSGYTRGADNSSCIPCSCFGHSSDCHDETGECYSCLHNTIGKTFKDFPLLIVYKFLCFLFQVLIPKGIYIINFVVNSFLVFPVKNYN